ncbi:hypothetical protein [Bdellovibrio sp. KM01]|uniref:hypothetical protein n=1 Tax=Bdellovibrio sp. KM01 TaxID=2748865 RepID=UPI0015E963C7|nr:hypothetical protein [Bdellovibrio sp. KM01]QLY27000.1 hypothetical protein HW988_08405 [Bdellovibrio sp. KM01]
MDLSKFSNNELVGRLESLCHSERKITHLILWHIVEIETRKLYLEMAYDSMFSYLTKKLGYSEDAAYRRISAARVLKKAPEISKKVEEGSVTLTQLAQVQKCLKQEKKYGGEVTEARTLEIVEQIQNKSNFETQKVLAVEFNQPVQARETLKPQKDDSARLELTFNSEQMASLKQVKDLLSHVLPDPTWAELISHLANKQIQKILGKQDATDAKLLGSQVAV